MVVDHGSYFVTTYKRNRLTRELKLKRKGKQGKMTNREGEEKEIKNINQVQLGKK